ncbi:cell wall-associated NlpC family hydrolase [Saccharothrix coeruleofusca]|uniref:NlpC/P60 family protein n=1 Tax=Saccharothrix coeruleofusca TaxID=33919 RepID=UPI001AE31425|nr:NlpC/P60 family protein [Saccharothrix coeruleofusca]MBP2337067.1 cell wall-associated NlpC family hydrolase [Saccharothrix coeruleofusca]
MGRWGACGAVVLTALVSFAGTATAVPPPDPEVSAGRKRLDPATPRVDTLTKELARVDARLRALADEVAHAAELADKARADFEAARGEAARARQAAEAAEAEAARADEAVEAARTALDEVATASYLQGSVVGSITAYFGATSPQDLLARVHLLEVAGGAGLGVLEEVRRSRAEKATRAAAARRALARAEREQAAADRAERAADAARALAAKARQEQAGQAVALGRDKAALEAELARAVGQARDADQRRAEGAAAPAVSSRGAVEIVVTRAMAQLGVRYSWGGGNHQGPTVGVRDWGVGDSHGDYRAVGFDCSGLMVYAFAGVGVRLPRHSGAQHNAGRKVPLAQAQRGDMLFWGPGGGTHVALYLGDGLMVEAPYSGSVVRLAPVRYGGITPYATRVL